MIMSTSHDMPVRKNPYSRSSAMVVSTFLALLPAWLTWTTTDADIAHRARQRPTGKILTRDQGVLAQLHVDDVLFVDLSLDDHRPRTRNREEHLAWGNGVALDQRIRRAGFRAKLLGSRRRKARELRCPRDRMSGA